MTINRLDRTRLTISADRRMLQHLSDLIARVSEQAHSGAVHEVHEDHGYIRITTETIGEADRYESIAESALLIERDAQK